MKHRKSKKDIAGEAYQVIGALAYTAKLFDNPDVQRALDYFSKQSWGNPRGEILPWAVQKEIQWGRTLKIQAGGE